MNRLQKAGLFLKSFVTPVAEEVEYLEEPISNPGIEVYQPEASFPTGGAVTGRRYNPTFSFSYDGEKNPGELGVIKRYKPNYRALRNRGWQAFLENDILQGIVGKFEEWVVGTGLRLQSHPVTSVLEEDGITLSEDHAQRVEQRFSLFKGSKASTYNKEKTLNQLESKAFRDSIIGGDMLVILHVVDLKIKVQVVDGEHLLSPAFSREGTAQGTGNSIRDGVEFDDRGEHVAYWIHTKTGKFERIEAVGDGGVRMAFLIYGMEYRHDNTRGIPLFSGIFEALKKMERYKEAAVASAEERAKIAYFFEHTKDSTGENPLSRGIEKSLPLNRTIEGGQDTNNDLSASIKMAAKIVATTGKQVFNLPNETTIKAPTSDMEINFKDFFETNLTPICAAVGIPVEVALSLFKNNFSASRAALKMWEHTVKVTRENFSLQFLKPIYNLWLILEDVRGTIQSPKLFKSTILDADDILFEAYTSCSFLGVNVPHVDPVKEVAAIRKKLGKGFEHVPLTTIQKAIEELGGGDITQVMNTIKKELELAPEAPTPEPAALPAGTAGSGE